MMQDNEKKILVFFCKHPENRIFLTPEITQNADFADFNCYTSNILDFLATTYAEMDSGPLNWWPKTQKVWKSVQKWPYYGDI